MTVEKSKKTKSSVRAQASATKPAARVTPGPKTKKSSAKAVTSTSIRASAVASKPVVPPTRIPVKTAVVKIHLSPERKKKYSQLLQRLQEKISKQISFLSNDSLSKADSDEARDDVTDDFDRDFALNLLTSEHDIMFEINQAMQRLKDKSYGRCEQCGTGIAAARLEAVPFARMCISCQAGTEKGKPRFQPFGNTLAEASRTTATQSSASSDE